MSRLRNLTARSPRHQAAFLQALLLLWAIRLAMWILPYRILRRSIAWASKRGARVSASPAQELKCVAWAVRRAGAFVPQATCLVQSLAGQLLLERRGFRCRLSIGVAKDESGAFSAHAWLHCGDQIVLGGAEEARHTAILTEGAV
jgi:hypothetical protein